MRRTFNVAVSLTKNDYAEFELRPPINMVSGDHGTNILKFTVYDNGLPVDLSGNIAKITCKTPSGNRQQQDMTISTPREGKMEVVLDQRFFTEGGTYLAEVQLYDPDNLKVRATLPRFTYDVDASLLEENRVVANEQFSILQQMVDTVASAEERSVQALDTATRAMNIATQKGDKATEEANRAKNEADRAKNEADRAWAADFAKHVTLDSEAQQKFDFIKHKVVNGVGSQISTTEKNLSINISTIKRIVYKGSYYNISGIKNLFSFGGITLGIDSSNAPYLTSKETGYKGLGKLVFTNAKEVKVIVEFIDNRTIEVMFFNGANKTVSVVGFNSELSGSTVYLYGRENVSGSCVCSTTGEENEIQHNFSVLNNSPSIKELRTTNAEGKTSILNLASSEDFVEMSTGRRLREEYMGVLKAMGEEVPSADGSPVKVNNGIEARLINAEIKGQTVKNYLKSDLFPSVRYTIASDSKITVLLADEFSWADRKTITLTQGVSYSVKATTNCRFILKTLDSVTTVIDKYLTANTAVAFTPANTVDVAVKILVSQTGTYPFDTYVTLTETSQINNVNSTISFGLSSTEAIVSNNGQQYPIYEPTIQGKTRILNAQGVEVEAGTAGARLVSLEPTDSKLPKLGSVLSISDYIDRAKNIAMLLTKNVTLTPQRDVTVEVSGAYSKIGFAIQDGVKEINTANVVCGTLKILSSSSYWTNPSKEGIVANVSSNTNRITIVLLSSKCGTTADSVIAYFKNNPHYIQCLSATPQEIHLTEEQMKAYNAYKKVISLGGVGDVKDTLEILEDGSGVYTKNFDTLSITSDSTINREYTPMESVDKFIVYVTSPTNQKNGALGDSNMYKVYTGGVWGGNYTNYGIFTDKTNNVIRIVQKSSEYGLNVSSTKEDVINTFKQRLLNNPITLMYQTVTPIITHIPKELVPAILTHKTNTLEAGGAVKPSSFKVTVPVDQIATINAELAAIKAVLNSPSNLLLSAKYVEDEFNKNNKLESEMMN